MKTTARSNASGRHDEVASKSFLVALCAAALSLGVAAPASGAVSCARTLSADVVAFDQPITFNRLGAANVNGMMYALKRDVVAKTAGTPPGPGNAQLRPDKRPRPLVLRIAAGDCLDVKLTNWLAGAANPNNIPQAGPPGINVFVDEQVTNRWVGFHANGMQLRDANASDGTYVGRNATSGLIAPGNEATYRLWGEKEGVFAVHSYGSTFGGDGNQGNTGNGLFGQIIVEPAGAMIYRSLVTEEEMRLITTARVPGTNHPIIDYEATYPSQAPWTLEGKAGVPVLNMIQGNAIVHSELEAMIIGPGLNGTFPQGTYPLESTGRRNPTIPNRLEPFRDFASMFHDEVDAAQAFPGYYNDPVFKYVLAGVKDAFMINYGSGGIGSEIIANRLGVGPMHDCLTCAYEEFFLTSFAVGDPAMLVDIPANLGLETIAPGQLPAAGTTGPKATRSIYPGDPINVHHSYTGDFVKIRNTHVGKEQHVFHLHNHQWLYNPNDDNSNYLDAQGIGPGSGYTYEINFGGSGNRNKSAGDSIFHCHFYPHFAQGMWYHWRHYDAFEEGTPLQASVGGVTVTDKPGTFHSTPFALWDGTPQLVDPLDRTKGSNARALPDGEIAVGVATVGIVPLPGKAMAPMPARVAIKANPLTTTGWGGATVPVGSLAVVDKADMLGPDGIAGTDDDKNPGYPYWIAGIEDVVGQRPPTPVLDMVTPAMITAIQADPTELRCKETATGRIIGAPVAGACPAGFTAVPNPIYASLVPAQADGFDGGLPRSALLGNAAGGAAAANVVSPRDFTKTLGKAKPVYFKETGEDAERVAMRFHSKRTHPTFANSYPAPAAVSANFITNGAPPMVGAPYHEPCMDDDGKQLLGQAGKFFSGEAGTAGNSVGASETTSGKNFTGSSFFNALNPRKYKGANIQFDAILNKVGYHYPQQRIVVLWEDAVPVITKAQPPEPLVMRLNTFDCALYSHTNLVPEFFEMDDYQVRTPTDIIGQHIHLPKWDLTTTDGSANGWNYEDGTLSPGAVRERIEAINCFNGDALACKPGVLPGTGTGPLLHAGNHPYFGQFGRADWVGARTTMQRWFADPVVNTENTDRGLGIIFTHDHYGPSTHQQIGLYATVLVQPAGSTWKHNETGVQLGQGPGGAGGRADGGPTSWQAVIEPPNTANSYREFYFEFSDFQHAYEKGKYVGAGPTGQPLAAYTPPAVMPFPGNGWIPNPGNFSGVTGVTESFRVAINPPARFQIAPLFPNLALEAVQCVPGLLTRPCPQAISVQDPGVLVVNYRHEPIALRVFDPAKLGPDGAPGAQADGVAGDLGYALASQLKDKLGNVTPITRAIPDLNKTEQQLAFWGKTLNAPTATIGGDPFTPMMRAYAGDVVRMKIQAGGHEEEHNATVLGLKWLHTGSGFGKGPNSGWRNSQAAGISEQFTLAVPLIPPAQTVKGDRDYVYNIDSSMDGWWSGTWGLLRTYDAARADLYKLPNNQNVVPDRVANRRDFDGVCKIANGTPTSPASRAVAANVIAILANDLLGDRAPAGITISPTDAVLTGGTRPLNTLHAGGPLTGTGTLTYNPRPMTIPPVDLGGGLVIGGNSGPLHDPTAMMYVHLEDVVPDVPDGAATPNGCKDSPGAPGVTKGTCKIRLKTGRKVEPLIIRASANDCITVTLYNRLPAIAPDLPTLGTLQGVAKRDRTGVNGSVPFDNNLIRPSSQVGIVPQLVMVDVQSFLGINAGTNVTQTVPPMDAAGKAGKGTFTWYAGDLMFDSTAKNTVTLTPTPIEFGGVGLSPADRVKQGQKSLVGGLSVARNGVANTPDANSRTQGTIGTNIRDFMLVMTKDNNHRYANGAAVEHMNGEGAGLPEDSQENSAMAMNYGIEPLWFRFGIPPNAPFGHCGGGCYGDEPDSHLAYSNSLVSPSNPLLGDPVTPVFTATAGKEVRIHSVVPHSTSRGTTLAIHGHVWQRDPYVCPGEARNGLTGACQMTSIGSREIGTNPQGFAQGAQESLTSMSHFTYRLPSAGGAAAVTGDYLFRDQMGFGNASGLWGILRVQ